jgi:hypothetical protein
MRALSVSLLAAAQTAAPETPPLPAASPDPAPALGSPDHPIVQSSPTPVADAYHLKAGDPSVVSNPPVPDTPQNRQAYGQPLSRAGKKTDAANN